MQAEYKYNYLGQQAIRTLTQTGQVINSVYGPDGNRMAEFDFDPVSKVSTLLREYVWFEGKPIAVIEGGAVYYVRSEHIGKPVFATDATGAKVWEATYLPFGGVHTSSGSPINLRFPGQWFQSESGLHQNWMRDYDPTTGRYIQADPLGLVDGASVYGYAGQNPGRYVDPRGEEASVWASPTMRRAIAAGGVAAISDSPLLPFGDIVGLCIVGAAYVYCANDAAMCSIATDDCADEWVKDQADCSARYGTCLSIAEVSPNPAGARRQCGVDYGACLDYVKETYLQCRGG